MRMICSQHRESARDPDHPLHEELNAPPLDKLMKRTTLGPSYSVLIHGCDPEEDAYKERRRNKKRLHTAFVKEHLNEEPEH